MDIRRIEYFLAVADTLSFTKAAAQLHISHQALSRQIQLLESELGGKLLERSTTHVALTEAGEKLSETFRAATASTSSTPRATRTFPRIPTAR